MRKVTTVKLDHEIWTQFRVFCITHDMKIGETLERLILQFMSAHTQIQGYTNSDSNSNPRLQTRSLQKLDAIHQNLQKYSVLDKKTLDNIIGAIAGYDRRTIRKYFKLLLEYRLIEPITLRKFKISSLSLEDVLKLRKSEMKIEKLQEV